MHIVVRDLRQSRRLGIAWAAQSRLASGIMIPAISAIDAPTLSHFRLHVTTSCRNFLPNHFQSSCFCLALLLMEKPSPCVPPNSSRLANPGNVKLGESSGKAGGLPVGFRHLSVCFGLIEKCGFHATGAKVAKIRLNLDSAVEVEVKRF